MPTLEPELKKGDEARVPEEINRLFANTDYVPEERVFALSEDLFQVFQVLLTSSLFERFEVESNLTHDGAPRFWAYKRKR